MIHLTSPYQAIASQLQPIASSLVLLMCRLWVASVFFHSGWLKVTNWESTLYLFEYEYQVPLLPWYIAAYLATGAELILPIFIVLGLLSRPAALMLFALNAVAVLSYPVLWVQGFNDHLFWGTMILNIMVWGAGKLSLDYRLFKYS